MTEYGGPTPPDPNQPGGNPSEFPPPPFGQTPFGQPAYGQPDARPSGAPPPNYLVWAILSTLFCCLPLGIVSIVFAAQVNSKFAAGDLAGAQDSSAKAKQFAIWSAIVGVDRRHHLRHRGRRRIVTAATGIRAGVRWTSLGRPAAVAGAAVGALTIVATVDPNEPGTTRRARSSPSPATPAPAVARCAPSTPSAHGDLAAAVSRNVLMVASVPLLLWLWVRWIRRTWIGGGRPRPAPAVVLWCGVVLVVAFWVLRNLAIGAALAP